MIGGINDHLCAILAGQEAEHPLQVYAVNGELVSGPQLSGIGVGGGRRLQFEPHQQVNLMDIVSRCKAGLNLPHGRSPLLLIATRLLIT